MEDERGIRWRREDRERGDEIVSPKILRGNTKDTLQEKERSEDLKDAAVLLSAADSTTDT